MYCLRLCSVAITCASLQSAVLCKAEQARFHLYCCLEGVNIGDHMCPSETGLELRFMGDRFTLVLQK